MYVPSRVLLQAMASLDSLPAGSEMSPVAPVLIA